MRRRATKDIGSLDLFLDIICNTFGGILFISLLVALLVNVDSRVVRDAAPTESIHLELVRNENRRADLAEQVTLLRRSVAQQEATLGSLVSTELIRLAASVKQRQREHARLVIDKSHVAGKASQTQIAINQLAQAAKDRSGKIAEANTQLMAIQKDLSDAVASRSKVAVIPKEKRTQLAGQHFFLQHGKLYGPVLVSGRGNNTKDFSFISSGGSTEVKATSGGGMKVDPHGRNVQQLQGKFKGISPSSYFITLFVWPESYVHFDAIREVFESKGLKYQLIPCEDGQKIYIGGTGPSGPTQVQG